MNTLSEVLKAWQADRTLTVCADALAIGVSTFHAYLAGTSTPRHRQVAFLAPRLGLTADALHQAIAAQLAAQRAALAHPTQAG